MPLMLVTKLRETIHLLLLSKGELRIRGIASKYRLMCETAN